MQVKPTQSQIDAVLNQCSELEDSGRNPYFGMTYAQGVRDAIDWMLGDSSDPPLSDD